MEPRAPVFCIATIHIEPLRVGCGLDIELSCTALTRLLLEDLQERRTSPPILACRMDDKQAQRHIIEQPTTLVIRRRIGLNKYATTYHAVRSFDARNVKTITVLGRSNACKAHLSMRPPRRMKTWRAKSSICVASGSPNTGVNDRISRLLMRTAHTRQVRLPRLFADQSACSVRCPDPLTHRLRTRQR